MVDHLKNDLLSACLDSNIYISAIAFHGKPLKVIEAAFDRDFLLVCSPLILEEVERNIINKLDVSSDRLKQFINDVASISSMYIPTGNLKIINYEPDNLILEIALIGGADVLVTGDKKHLLPLHKYHGIIIEPPSQFLKRLDQNS